MGWGVILRNPRKLDIVKLSQDRDIVGCVSLGKSKIWSLISDQMDALLPKKQELKVDFLPWQPLWDISTEHKISEQIFYPLNVS